MKLLVNIHALGVDPAEQDDDKLKDEIFSGLKTAYKDEKSDAYLRESYDATLGRVNPTKFITMAKAWNDERTGGMAHPQAGDGRPGRRRTVPVRPVVALCALGHLRGEQLRIPMVPLRGIGERAHRHRGEPAGLGHTHGLSRLKGDQYHEDSRT